MRNKYTCGTLIVSPLLARLSALPSYSVYHGDFSVKRSLDMVLAHYGAAVTFPLFWITSKQDFYLC